MEALRLQGNAAFAADPATAAASYTAAMDLYDASRSRSNSDTACSLEEFTKSAGNALTCLFKLGRRAECTALAHRALAVNPIFAKANAFIGRCCDGGGDGDKDGNGDGAALMFLCRAIYLLPAMEESARPSIKAELDRLLAAEKKANNEPPVTTAAVEVRAGSAGNGVVAAAAIPAFTLVSDMQRPFSVASYEETGGRGLCACCGRNIANYVNDGDGDGELLGCERCGSVFYCSSLCASAHRASQHAPFECPRLMKLRQLLAMVEARGIDAPAEFADLATHTVTTIAAFQAQRPGWEHLARLESHGREVAVALGPAAGLLHDLYSDTPALTRDFITEVIGIVRCNSLEIAEASGMGVGQALYCGELATTSYFNHSCAPNCAIDTISHSIVTTRAIARGEELCISYLPQLYWPCRLRRDRLAEHFYFTCRCTRCVASDAGADPFDKATQMALPLPSSGGATVSKESDDESSRAAVTARLHVRVQRLCDEVRGLAVADITAAAHLTAVRSLQSELDTHLYPFHYLHHELRNLLTFVFAVLGRAKECMVSCLQELLMWESTVPGALPVKQMKLRNALQCLEGADEAELGVGEDGVLACAAPLYPHLLKLALVYGAAGMGDEEE